MKLFFSPGACSLAPHIVSRELGLNVEAVKVDLPAKKYAGGDFLKINPKGQVPTLQTEKGDILTEGAVIMEYLSDQAPGKNLMPSAGSWERYRCQEWLNFVATEMHKGFGVLWNRAMPEEAKEITRTTLSKKIEFLNEHFKTNDFLMGKTMTVADPYLFTILSWSKIHKIDLTPFPKVMGFIERMMSRPSVQTAMQEEGLLGGKH